MFNLDLKKLTSICVWVSGGEYDIQSSSLNLVVLIPDWLLVQYFW